MALDDDELGEAVDWILNPEPEEGQVWGMRPAHTRLKDFHGLDTSYRGTFCLEETKIDRRVGASGDPLVPLLQSIHTPSTFFLAGMRLLGDSILTYRQRRKTAAWGEYRFYPGILSLFWSGFEAYVRIYSEMFLEVQKTPVPTAHRLALLELEELVEKNGDVAVRTRFRPVLERYWILLKLGSGVSMDRGSKIWQAGEVSLKKRNALVHYDVKDVPAITSKELGESIEAVLLLLIAPSCTAKRTLLFHQYEYYAALAKLLALLEDFEERPILKGLKAGSFFFPLPFNGIDEARYPNVDQIPPPKKP